MFADELKALRRLGFRHVRPSNVGWPGQLTYAVAQVLLQVLNFIQELASGFMMWKGLGLVTNTESPIVVVLRYAHSYHPQWIAHRSLCKVGQWNLRSTAATCSS